MIPLVKHFLRRARWTVAIFIAVIVFGAFVGGAGYNPSKFRPHFGMIIVMFFFCNIILSGLAEEAQEFDLVLPVRRRTLFVARHFAALLFMALFAVPLFAAAMIYAAVRGDLWETLWFCATLPLCWIALLLMGPLVMRFVRRTCLALSIPIGVVLLGGIFAFQMMASQGRIWSFLSVFVPALAAMLSWFLGCRQFERFDLIPAGDAGPAQGAIARPRLTDRFSPMVRVLAHAVWLNWWYWLAVVWVAFLCFFLGAGRSPESWISYVMYPLCFGGFIPMLLSRTGQALLPRVPRQIILRSALGPMAAAPILVGCVAAIVAGSTRMMILGLTTALLVVVAAWLWLPWKEEYRRPFLAWGRAGLTVFLVLGFLSCAFVPVVKETVCRWLMTTSLRVSPWTDGRPVLVCCAMLLVVALFWWLCERKFRHFEPFAMPSGLLGTVTYYKCRNNR